MFKKNWVFIQIRCISPLCRSANRPRKRSECTLTTIGSGQFLYNQLQPSACEGEVAKFWFFLKKIKFSWTPCTFSFTQSLLIYFLICPFTLKSFSGYSSDTDALDLGSMPRPPAAGRPSSSSWPWTRFKCKPLLWHRFLMIIKGRNTFNQHKIYFVYFQLGNRSSRTASQHCLATSVHFTL